MLTLDQAERLQRPLRDQLDGKWAQLSVQQAVDHGHEVALTSQAAAAGCLAVQPS